MAPRGNVQPHGDEHRPSRILVVEDEVLLRSMIAEELRSEGYQVMEASSADEAIALLTATPQIDLVFSDIQMPGEKNGIQLAQFVHETHPGVVVILTSAVGHPGLDGEIFVPKPFRLLETVALINRYLSVT